MSESLQWNFKLPERISESLQKNINNMEGYLNPSSGNIYPGLSPNLMNLSRLSNPPKKVSIERRLKSWNIEYKFKWNQLYLSRVSNLSHGSNF